MQNLRPAPSLMDASLHPVFEQHLLHHLEADDLGRLACTSKHLLALIAGADVQV